MDEQEVNAASRDQLYEMAKQHQVSGRSSMSKDQLRDALLQQSDGSGDADAAPTHIGSPKAASRVEGFRLLAEASARREFVMLPRLLGGNDRRLHVRQTVREDHQTRIKQRAEGAEVKFQKLADSVFSFFRGTALLFYRDMVGEDAWMPTVLTLGDVHPANFGVMPNANNVPIFAANDFDEAYYAPFTWDLKRGAVGFMLASDEASGCGAKKQRKIASRFIRGYIDGIATFAKDESEKEKEVRLDNAPKMIRSLIQDAQTDRAQWLAEDYLDEFRRGFRSDEELVPLTSRCSEFQSLVQQMVDVNDMQPPPRAGEMRVKDVAVRRGQGTASLGLPRYYVLIEGPRRDGSDDLILEFKQARCSALAGLVPPTNFAFDAPGDRIAHAQAVQLVRGDRFYGSVRFEGKSFMSRERAPYRDDIDLDELSKSDWKTYADICGRSLAHAHALSDEVGNLDHDVEPQIVEAVGAPDLFVDDIIRFAEDAAERVRRDHSLYRADHEMGAFQTVDLMYK